MNDGLRKAFAKKRRQKFESWWLTETPAEGTTLTLENLQETINKLEKDLEDDEN